MTFFAPVICKVVGRIFHHTNAKTGELESFPEGGTGVSFVFNRRDGGPGGGLEGDDSIHISVI